MATSSRGVGVLCELEEFLHVLRVLEAQGHRGLVVAQVVLSVWQTQTRLVINRPAPHQTRTRTVSAWAQAGTWVSEVELTWPSAAILMLGWSGSMREPK